MERLDTRERRHHVLEQPRDPVDAYVQAYRFFARSRLNLTVVDDRGTVRALSPLAVAQSHWPFPDILNAPVPENSRSLYVEPAEKAWTTGRVVTLPPTRQSTRNRDLFLSVRHIPFRDTRQGCSISLVVTHHLESPDCWAPPVTDSEIDRTRFAELVETQAALWAEANAWLRDAARRGEHDVSKAARVASGAGRRLEAMLDALLTAWSVPTA